MTDHLDCEPFEPDHDLVVKVAEYLSQVPRGQAYMVAAYGVLIHLYDLGIEVPAAVDVPLGGVMEPVLCPISPELVERLKAGWTTDCPVRMWLGEDNVLHVAEIRTVQGPHTTPPDPT